MENSSINLVEMGNRIKLLRTKQKKTQKYFADLLYISPSYLALIEQGKRTVTLDVLAQIALVCDVSTDYLLFGISNEQNEQDEKNFRTFKRLSNCYPPHKLKNALRLAEYYLSLNDSIDDSKD